MSNKLKEVESYVSDYIELLNLVCECGNLCDSIIEEGDIKLITTPEKYKLKNIKDWEKKISSVESWLISHEEEVIEYISENLSPDELDDILALFENHFIGSKLYNTIHKSKKSKIIAITYECVDERCVESTRPHYHRFIEETNR